MWMNLSYLYANDKEVSSISRSTQNKLEKMMSKEQITRAQELASECYTKNSKAVRSTQN